MTGSMDNQKTGQTGMDSSRASLSAACLIFGLTLLVYMAWYVSVWPGLLGPDGYSIIANINGGTPSQSGKEPAWILYALMTYGSTGRVEALVLPLVLVNVLVLARMVHFVWMRVSRPLAVLGLLFVVLAPHIINLSVNAYPDSAFSVAFVGVLFEVWLALRRRRLGSQNLIMLAILFPMACFFRSNGVLILIPLVVLFFVLRRTSGGLALLVIVLAWAGAVQAGAHALESSASHGALRPLVLFETVNFMQTRPMVLWENRHMVTKKTQDLVHRYADQEALDKFYDRDYWDTLWHQNFDSIHFRQMSRQDWRVLIGEFFKYNLWRNLPAFLSSRVNILLASAMAQGGFVHPHRAEAELELVHTRSRYNPFGLKYANAWTESIFLGSFALRFILWTPFVGVALMFMVLRRARRDSRMPELLVAVTLCAELLGIFFMSVAAEYRYLLMFFYAPLLLMPMYCQLRQDAATARTGSVA